MISKFLFLVWGVAILVPSLGSAHGISSFEEARTGSGMMRYIEDASIQSDELHEEMENLMVNMIAGELTQEEADRLVQLMEQYPAPMSIMMNRFGSSQTGEWGMMNGFGWGMMDGIGTFLAWLFTLTWIVWLAVGVLAVVWLWKQIRRT
ncbi:MAG: hypothetical protein Q8P39_03690 [Candidatus Yanofskybacteria bacterium]|nr:hypothetical protein [Candidatus Yanofskybacteria bacterium]